MYNFLTSPLFFLAATLLIFFGFSKIYQKVNISILNPLLLTTALIVTFLAVFNIDYNSYKSSVEVIDFMLEPSVVALGYVLYKQSGHIKANLKPITIGIFIGSFIAIISVILLSNLFGLSSQIITSLVPKSITTPIAIKLSNQLGAVESLTIISVVIAGVSGAIIAPFVFRIFRISDPIAKGLALGSASHAIGTTKAVEIGVLEGAISGLAIGLMGIATCLIAPLLVSLFC